MDISVLTINIAGVQFDWFGERRKSLIKEINQLNPDVIFLQESTIVFKSSYDQTQDISQKTGLKHFAFSPYGNDREYESERLGGVSILSRWPFKHVQNRKLPSGTIDKYGARVALMAMIELDETDVVLATTHLTWRPEERKVRVAQMETFLDMVNFSDELTIFGGDFNASPEDPSVQSCRDIFDDAYFNLHGDKDGVTWCQSTNKYIKSTWRGDARIDYLFCSKDIEVMSAEVVMKKENPVYPSDHFGVLATFNIDVLT